MSWVPTVVSLAVGTIGAGGLAALLRVAHDHTVARRTAQRDDDAAADGRWASLVETQTRSLLEPLQRQVDRHAARISELEDEVHDVRERHWRALRLINALYAHIARHSVRDAPPPPPFPADLGD